MPDGGAAWNMELVSNLPKPEGNEMHRWRKWESVVNILLIAVALLTLARAAWGLDTQDIVVEWTPEMACGLSQL